MNKPTIVMPVWAIDSETINITENAVESLKGFPLIIVDNGSSVGGGQLREWADVYIRNRENLGYAKACNQGIKLCKELAVLANNDIRVSPNWWEVSEEILKNPKVATVHFRMLPYDQPFEYGNDTWLEGKERWCSGSFYVIRSNWLFDENFLNSYDDWDLQYRIRKAGFITAYTNKACYQHMDSYTQQKIPMRNENDLRNREFFKSKHGDYPENIWNKNYPEQMRKEWKPFP